MAAVAVALLDRPPTQEAAAEPVNDATSPIGADGIQIVGDADTLMSKCSCTSSSDQPY